jgi:Flp pilus assembly protein TadG
VCPHAVSGVSRGTEGERGQALVLTALCCVMLVGMLGFATDVGLLLMAKRNLQVAADSAALAGAAELNYGDYASAAQAAAAQNGFTNGSNGVTVSVNPSGTANPSPLNGPYKNQAGYLEVVITQIRSTFFMKVFHWSSMSVSARAVGTLGSSSGCIYLLATSGTNLTMSNAGQLTASSCGLMDDSSSSASISVIGGSTLAVSTIGLVGNDTVSGGGTITPAAVTGIAPFSDPMAYLTAPTYSASSCGSDPLTHYGNGGSSYSVGPGSTYSTTQNGNTVCYTSLSLGINNDTVTVNPGIYVITGAMTFASGTVAGGAGVTFYLTGSASLSIGNGATFTLSAPTSGTYNGILFYQDRADTTAASIQGGATSVLKGILYFPNAALSIGNGTSSTFYTPIIANSLTIVGGSTVTDNDYSTVNPSTPLTSPRIVD